MVAPGHWLRGLQMGEAGHHPVGPGLRLPDKCHTQVRQFADGLIAAVPDPEPEVGCDLIVAAPRRMQPPGRFADDLFQPRLDIHVNVFQRRRKGELSGLDL